MNSILIDKATYNLQVILISEESNTLVRQIYKLLASIPVNGGKVVFTTDTPIEHQAKLIGNLDSILSVFAFSLKSGIIFNSISFKELDFNVVFEGDLDKLNL